MINQPEPLINQQAARPVFLFLYNYCKNDKKYLTNTVKAYILIIVKQTIKEG
jgi:hypothetical protein